MTVHGMHCEASIESMRPRRPSTPSSPISHTWGSGVPKTSAASGKARRSLYRPQSDCRARVVGAGDGHHCRSRPVLCVCDAPRRRSLRALGLRLLPTGTLDFSCFIRYLRRLPSTEGLALDGEGRQDDARAQPAQRLSTRLPAPQGMALLARVPASNGSDAARDRVPRSMRATLPLPAAVKSFFSCKISQWTRPQGCRQARLWCGAPSRTCCVPPRSRPRSRPALPTEAG